MFAQYFTRMLLYSTYAPEHFKENGLLLADFLGMGTHRVPKSEEQKFTTGDDDVDRLALADWVESGARAPSYCSPPWGRNFAEQTAALLRHRLFSSVLLDYDAAEKIVYEEKLQRYRRSEPEAASDVDLDRVGGPQCRDHWEESWEEKDEHFSTFAKTQHVKAKLGEPCPVCAEGKSDLQIDQNEVMVMAQALTHIFFLTEDGDRDQWESLLDEIAATATAALTHGGDQKKNKPDNKT